MLLRLLKRLKLFTKKETASAVSFFMHFVKNNMDMVIVNKKRMCGMDIFSKSFAGYILAFFVDSAKI